MNAYKEFQKYYGDNAQGILEMFLSTEGCYMAYANGSLGLVYRCYKEKPYLVNSKGPDIFVQWGSGNNWQSLLQLIEPDTILFDRRGKLRSYNFQKLLRRSCK